MTTTSTTSTSCADAGRRALVLQLVAQLFDLPSEVLEADFHLACTSLANDHVAVLSWTGAQVGPPLFSYDASADRHCDPDAVTHRYSDMCGSVGIDSHLHALRHYSATELLTGGVDLRTVAGRLGHGGGGATTLRVYAAWVGESDRRAAELLGSRMQRPT